PRRAEQLVAARHGQGLDLVDDLAPPVVALARVALRVLVRQHRTDGLEDLPRHEVLGGDELEAVPLTLVLACDELEDRGVPRHAAEYMSGPPAEPRGAGPRPTGTSPSPRAPAGPRERMPAGHPFLPVLTRAWQREERGRVRGSSQPPRALAGAAGGERKALHGTVGRQGRPGHRRRV